MSDRRFPFQPASSDELEVGDLIGVPYAGDLIGAPYADGLWGVLQVISIDQGDSKTFGVCLVNWGGSQPPTAASVVACERLEDGLTDLAIFSEGGAQVVDHAPLLELRDPEDDPPEREPIWDWRTAMAFAQSLAPICCPQQAPLEIVPGPSIEVAWTLDVEHYQPADKEPIISERLRGGGATRLSVEQKIADYMDEYAALVVRTVHLFDQRVFHLADGSRVEFWWRVHVHDHNRRHCMDCGVDTYDIHEYYKVRDNLWNRATYPDWDGMLCIGCLETRIGRQLVRSDFGDGRGVPDPTGLSARLFDRYNTEHGQASRDSLRDQDVKPQRRP